METVHVGGAPILFGQFGAFLTWDVCAAALALVVIVSVGIWIIWRTRTGLAEEEQPASVDQQLGHYAELLETGEIDEAEFQRIKARLENPTVPGDDDPPKDDQPPDTSIRAM